MGDEDNKNKTLAEIYAKNLSEVQKWNKLRQNKIN